MDIFNSRKKIEQDIFDIYKKTEKDILNKPIGFVLFVNTVLQIKYEFEKVKILAGKERIFNSNIYEYFMEIFPTFINFITDNTSLLNLHAQNYINQYPLEINDLEKN